MKPAVLCITRSVLPASIPQSNAYGIYPVDLTTLPEDAFHFINRAVVDSTTHPNFAIGRALPQILGYCVIRCGEYVLTYSRKKGAESRLHGSRSIGFGGHVDIGDYSEQSDEYVGYLGALIKACERELNEELGLRSSVNTQYFNSIIVDQTNSVGEVHVGLPLHFHLQTRNELEINPDEISDPVWVTISDLKNEKDQYENWSKLLIEQL